MRKGLQDKLTLSNGWSEVLNGEKPRKYPASNRNIQYFAQPIAHGSIFYHTVVITFFPVSVIGTARAYLKGPSCKILLAREWYIG
jgi:hypothetical protein